ncbi:MAG: ATP synthase F1 subunit epsilon [Chloroflexota bacterium]|nr:ATP synthase F1 subunit epsilon [Chloroflexota bacterium]
MATTQLAIVAAERNVFAGEVDMVLAPSAVGQLGILPRHAPLLTLLVPGTLHIRQGASERLLAVGGGFLEADQNHITALVNSAEWAEEVDVTRAESAGERARQRLRARDPGTDLVRAEAALRRSTARLKTVERVGRTGPRDLNQP